jgi:hypothetical protein
MKIVKESVVIMRGFVLASPKRSKQLQWNRGFRGSITMSPRLDRGSVECFESASTWIRGDQQVTKTTVKKSVSNLLISSLKVHFLHLL